MSAPGVDRVWGFHHTLDLPLFSFLDIVQFFALESAGPRKRIRDFSIWMCLDWKHINCSIADYVSKSTRTGISNCQNARCVCCILAACQRVLSYLCKSRGERGGTSSWVSSTQNRFKKVRFSGGIFGIGSECPLLELWWSNVWYLKMLNKQDIFKKQLLPTGSQSGHPLARASHRTSSAGLGRPFGTSTLERKGENSPVATTQGRGGSLNADTWWTSSQYIFTAYFARMHLCIGVCGAQRGFAALKGRGEKTRIVEHYSGIKPWVLVLWQMGYFERRIFRRG